jgi:threonine/homoserine/homoserine lactone efflux protein
MGSVIGELIPLAVAVAITPISIIAVILMLFAHHASRTVAGFLLGWVVGIVVALVVFELIAGAINLGSTAQPSTGASWLTLILGVGLILLGLWEWRHRPRPGQAADLPARLSAVDTLTAERAARLGLALAVANPKNLVMAIAAGLAIAGGHLGVGQQVIAIAVFTVVAGSTLAAPVIAYALAAARARPPLDRQKTWLAEHNADVLGAVLVLIGAVLVGKGIGGML